MQAEKYVTIQFVPEIPNIDSNNNIREEKRTEAENERENLPYFFENVTAEPVVTE